MTLTNFFNRKIRSKGRNPDVCPVVRIDNNKTSLNTRERSQAVSNLLGLTERTGNARKGVKVRLY